jgi:endoglucanase
MNITKRAGILAAAIFLQASGAMAAIVIGAPAANSVKDKNNLTVEVNGSCTAGTILKINATDSAGKATSQVWTQCQPWGFSVQINISPLKDGAIKVAVLQDKLRNPQSASVNISKKTSAVVVTPPVVVPPVTPPVTPPVVVPPVVVVPPAAGTNIVMGVNGHDGDGRVGSLYPNSQSEAIFKILNSKNLRSYRFNVDPRNFTTLDNLVALSKKYNITLRPMIFAISTDAAVLKDSAYQAAKRYSADIKIWEIENENDSSKDGAQDRINRMAAMYKGVKQASDELGAGLKTTINVMACNTDDKSATARCPGDVGGSMWFLDMAKASGFNFDYVSFHYYPFLSDKGYYYSMYLGQMRAMATKFKTKIFYNEMSCADIYYGNTDGGFAGDKACYDSVKQILTELNTNYKDIVQEINMYEMLDEPINGGIERHFGLFYNLASPKALFDLVTSFAK